MIPARFDYDVAESVDHAIELLAGRVAGRLAKALERQRDDAQLRLLVRRHVLLQPAVVVGIGLGAGTHDLVQLGVAGGAVAAQRRAQQRQGPGVGAHAGSER